MRLVQRNPLANSRRVNSMDRRRTRKALISAQIAIDNRALETRTVSGHAKPPKVVSNFRGSVHLGGVFLRVTFAVGMTEIAVRVDHVAHQLLELCRIRKATVALAVPD